MEVQYCPGCSSPDFKIRGRQGPAFDTPVGDLLFRQPDYFVKACLSCGLYYKSHTLSSADLTLYYQNIDHSKWEVDCLFPSEQALIALLSMLPAGSRILDYGCSSGRLLASLTGAYKCFGVEINERAAASAKSKGLTMLSEQQLESTARFDAIVLCDVFEHLTAPTTLLQMLSLRLEQGGLLILCTGNADAAACQKDIANFWYFRTPEHLCMLGQKYANHLASMLSLSLMAWKEVTHYKFRLAERAKQHAKNFAYWQFHDERGSIWAPILKLVPFANRARCWPVPPALTCTEDHVLVVLANSATP